MKSNLVFTLIFLSFLNAVSAQAIRFGLKAGAGLSNLVFSAPNTADTIDQVYHAQIWYDRKTAFKPAFLVGGVMEYDLTKAILLSSGINLSTKYARVQYVEEMYKRDFRLSLLNMQIPLNVHYRAGRFFLGAGAYLGFCVSGKWKIKEVFVSPNGTSEENGGEPITFGSDPEFDNLKRIDAGVRAEIGYGLKTLRLSLAYDQGLTNNLPTVGNGTVYDVAMRHQAIYATVTYYWLAK